MDAQELDWGACRAAMADYLENSFLVLDEDVEKQIYSAPFRGPVFGEYEGSHHFLAKPGSRYKGKGGG